MAAIPSISIANDGQEPVASVRCAHATWQAIQVATVTSIRCLEWTCDGIASGVRSIDGMMNRMLGRSTCIVDDVVLPRLAATEVQSSLPTFVEGWKVDQCAMAWGK